MTYPVLSVLDNSGDHNIIWHVQTYPAALPTGAWIADEQQLTDLLKDTVVFLTPGSTAPENAPVATIEGVRVDVDKQVAEYNKHGIRLPSLGARTVEAQYRGEPEAEAAWRTAMELGEIAGSWLEIEAKRRARKALAEAFGAEVQPLPLDTE